MNDSNAIAERESTETIGIWRRAVSSELTFGDNLWTGKASQRFDMRQPELLSLITTNDDKTCEPSELHWYV